MATQRESSVTDIVVSALRMYIAVDGVDVSRIRVVSETEAESTVCEQSSCQCGGCGAPSI
jgi:hypothetical protein